MMMLITTWGPIQGFEQPCKYRSETPSVHQLGKVRIRHLASMKAHIVILFLGWGEKAIPRMNWLIAAASIWFWIRQFSSWTPTAVFGGSYLLMILPVEWPAFDLSSQSLQLSNYRSADSRCGDCVKEISEHNSIAVALLKRIWANAH